MPPLKDVDSMVTAARSRKMRFTFIIQNFAQLNDVYGKEVAEVIRGNCGNTIYLISHELAALEEISKMCGEVKSKDKDKTASTPLITVTDLQKLKFPDALLMRMRLNPYKTKLPLNDKVDWGYTFKEAEFTTRETTPVQIFDIKTFVKDKKREKMMEAVNNSDNDLTNTMQPDMLGMPGMSGMPNFGGLPGMNNPIGGPMNLSDMDLDQMIKDIDKKIAELDAEDAKKKEAEKDTNAANNIQDIKPEIPKVNESIDEEIDIKPEHEEPIKEEIKPNHEIISDIMDNNDFVLPNPTNIDEAYNLPKAQPKVEIKDEGTLNDIPKPKINVDADSIVVNDNVISDDEFFDDFFGEDDSNK
jgi:hypothetical protein